MYYSKQEYKLVGFRKSTRKGKMYDAILENKETKRLKHIAFGDNQMENYHDKTGLNLYPSLIHGNTKRRDNYRKRARGKVKNGFYSPSYFSYFFLW